MTCPELDAKHGDVISIDMPCAQDVSNRQGWKRGSASGGGEPGCLAE